MTDLILIWTIEYCGHFFISTYPVKLTGDAAGGAAGTTVFDISYGFMNLRIIFFKTRLMPFSKWLNYLLFACNVTLICGGSWPQIPKGQKRWLKRTMITMRLLCLNDLQRRESCEHKYTMFRLKSSIRWPDQLLVFSTSRSSVYSIYGTTLNFEKMYHALHCKMSCKHLKLGHFEGR